MLIRKVPEGGYKGIYTAKLLKLDLTTCIPAIRGCKRAIVQLIRLHGYATPA